MKKFFKSKFFIAFIVIVLLVSLAGNVYLFREVNIERERVKNAVVPILNDDYFTRRVLAAQWEKEMFEEELLHVEFDNVSREKVHFDVKRVSQLPDFPNGCEAASAVMLLNFYGIEISLNDFIEKYLPKEAVYEWQDTDGNRTYTYPKNSHTVLLTGYDDEYYYINDPLKPDDTVKVEKEKLEKSFYSIGCQAVSIVTTDVTDDVADFMEENNVSNMKDFLKVYQGELNRQAAEEVSYPHDEVFE